MVYLTKVFTFSAAHEMRSPSFTPERNEEVFGKCSRLHGHNYRLEVTVQGEVDESTGMVMDLPLLETAVREEVLARLGGREIVLARGGAPRVVTAENIMTTIWDRLRTRLGASLHRVRLVETDKNSFEYSEQGPSEGRERGWKS